VTIFVKKHWVLLLKSTNFVSFGSKFIKSSSDLILGINFAFFVSRERFKSLV